MEKGRFGNLMDGDSGTEVPLPGYRMRQGSPVSCQRKMKMRMVRMAKRRRTEPTIQAARRISLRDSWGGVGVISKSETRNSKFETRSKFEVRKEDYGVRI